MTDLKLEFATVISRTGTKGLKRREYNSQITLLAVATDYLNTALKDLVTLSVEGDVIAEDGLTVAEKQGKLLLTKL